jgi:hypothetical protein
MMAAARSAKALVGSSKSLHAIGQCAGRVVHLDRTGIAVSRGSSSGGTDRQARPPRGNRRGRPVAV